LRDIGSEIELRARIEQLLRQLLLFCNCWNHLTIQIVKRQPASERLDVGTAMQDRRAFIARLIDGIAGIQAEASAFVCVFSGSQSHARFDGLARDLRRTLTRHLDRVFAEAFPRLPKEDRGRMLAAWSDITSAMISNLDRSKPGERGKLLEELKTVLGAYLDAKLAAFLA